MPQRPIFILDIPHILSIVAQDLTPHDLVQCTLTNKDWSTYFSPFLYQTIQVCDPHQHLFFTRSPETCLALPRHKFAVRTLQTAYPDLLELIGNHTKHLRHLLITEHWGKEPACEIEQLTAVIECNRGLESVKAKGIRLDQDAAVKALFNSFSCPQPLALTTLDLWSRSIQRPVPVERIVFMLRNCPRTVKKLSLMTPIVHGQVPYLPSNLLFSQDDQKPIPSLAVEDLRLGQSLVGFEDSILFPCLRMCPKLRKFELPAMSENRHLDLALVLEKNCPELADWTVQEITIDEVLARLIGCVQKLTRVKIVIRTELGRNAGMALLHQASMLERVDITTGGGIYDNRFIQQLLCSSPSLKTLWMKDGFAHFDDDFLMWDDTVHPLMGLNAQDLVLESSTPTRPPVYAPEWVCHQLEDLMLILWNVPHHSPTAQSNNLEEDKDDLQRELYRRIGNLARLKRLDISFERSIYEDGAGIQTDSLQISLQRGLELLKGLRQLECLRIRRVLQDELTVCELEWMVEHWPRLKGVIGLRNYGHVKWLRARGVLDALSERVLQCT